MSSYAKVIKNSGFLYIRTIVSLCVNVYSTRIILEALGVSDYGLYNVVGGAVSMLGFLSATLSSTTQRYINYAEGQGDITGIKKTFNNSLILHNIIALISALLLIIAGFCLFNGVLNIPPGQQTAAIIVYGCLIISTVFSITVTPYDATIVAHENMAFYSILGIIDVLLKLLIAISILYIPDQKLIYYAMLLAFESVILRSISKQYCRHMYQSCREIAFRKFYDRIHIKEMATFAGWNMSNVVTGMVSLYGNNIIINHFFGTGLNAAMGIATQLSGVLMGIAANMIKSLTPALVKAEGRQDRKKLREMSYLGCKYSFLVTSFFSTPIMVFISYILGIWLKVVPDWTEQFCLITIAAILVDQATVTLYHSIMAQGEIKRYNIARSFCNILPLIISTTMFCYGNFSPIWAILNWALWKSVIGGMINCYFAHTNFGFDIRLFIRLSLIPGISCLLICFFLGYLLKHLDLNLPDMVKFIGLFIVSVPVYWIMGISNNEKKMLRSLICKKN